MCCGKATELKQLKKNEKKNKTPSEKAKKKQPPSGEK